jgi:SNF2 family DNA or RNA helicase
MPLVPYKHQIQAVEKLGSTKLPSRLIADDMGLGKTFEALLIDAELRSERQWKLNPERREWPPYKRPTLIVAPLATHYDAWYKTLYQMLSGRDLWDDASIHRNVEVIDRKNRTRLSQRLAAGQGHWPAFVIVHYDGVRLMPELADVKWFHIIADEVHRVKSRTAQQTLALKKIPTFFKTGLSGTPADDKPQDIWSVLNWLYPKEFSSYWKFVKEYCEESTDTNRSTGKTFRKLTGVNKAAIPKLHRQIAPYYIRRMKSNVGIDLPPKTYTELHVDLYPAQRRAYDQMRKDMLAWIGEHEDTPLSAPAVVTQLVRLQQMALASVEFNEEGKVKLCEPSAKLDRLMELMEGNPNTPLVVFSQSRSMVDLVINRARKAGIPCAPYTGSVSQRMRDVAVREFQEGYTLLLAATIGAGGEGITLHRASNVVFLDRSWNPTKNVQAEDRLHRIGQVNPVQVIDFIANNTVDQGRRQRIANKWRELRLLLGDTVLDENTSVNLIRSVNA